MPESFEIVSAFGRYPVEISEGLYSRQVQSRPEDAVAVCDQRFAEELEASGWRTVAIEADERVKSLDRMSEVIVALRRLGVNRSTHLFAIGGGVVQDVAAFCAAIYMRGLQWTYFPTTLLGMVDSCIGGKSSINVGEYKNIVGTFSPPTRVAVDPRLAATLTEEQRAAGLCEAVKICYCRGPAALEAYRALNPGVTMSEPSLEALIDLSLCSKKWFIEIDEFDRGERLLLNFGHTFGHAIEGAAHYGITHGVAVGIGIRCALALGRRLGNDYSPFAGVQYLSDHISELIRAVPGVSSILDRLEPAMLLDRFQADKKHSASHFRVITLDGDGKAVLLNLERNAATLEQVAGAYSDAFRA